MELNTNEDLVIDLMNYSPRGALSQAFIMHAIQKYAADVIEAGAEAMSSPMLNGQAWVDVAVDVKARCDKFYGRHDAPAKPPIGVWRHTPAGAWVLKGNEGVDIGNVFILLHSGRWKGMAWATNTEAAHDNASQAKAWVEEQLTA